MGGFEQVVGKSVRRDVYVEGTFREGGSEERGLGLEPVTAKTLASVRQPALPLHAVVLILNPRILPSGISLR